jgi:hypothetical protein
MSPINHLLIRCLDLDDIAAKRRNWYVNTTPNLSDQTKELILAGKWEIGMKQRDFVASIGYPYTTNRTTPASIVHQQWMYKRYKYTYFYFDKIINTEGKENYVV